MATCFRHLRLLGTVFLLLSSLPYLRADGGRFDLTGPKIDVRVTRDGKILPIASVPNLLAGDQIWIHPDLPSSQSVRYLLIAAFLRGTTNPPPDGWFTRIETWDKHVRSEGVSITVPAEAQQAILFLAPETGGDFSTLRSAVKGRPGVFVRASQDLAEAGFEQARIEKYLASIRLVPPADSKALMQHSTLLARTLNLKPNEDCFKRPVDQQYNCLTQTGTQTLLEDGHGQTVVSSLTSGAGSDFINAASATSLAGGGVYSAYVGAVVDLVRIMGGLHTAHYQYIPAIAFPEQEALNLRLNTPPSFQNPKSVIVIGLPAIQASTPPPLRPSDPNQVTCLLRPKLVLAVEGAPLVFSTAFAHDMRLHVDGSPASEDIPLAPDAFQGGLVKTKEANRHILPSGESDSSRVDEVAASDIKQPKRAEVAAKKSGDGDDVTLTGSISGFWGFDHFSGPSLPVQKVPGQGWQFAQGDSQIIAGEQNHLLLSSNGTACISGISTEGVAGAPAKVDWKPSDKRNVVDVTLALNSAAPGSLHLDIKQFGKSDPDIISSQTFSKPAALKSIEFHAHDTQAMLLGDGLKSVQELRLSSSRFVPSNKGANGAGALTANNSATGLQMDLAPGESTPSAEAGEHITAKVTLTDSRVLPVNTIVAPQRPSVSILSKQFDFTVPSTMKLSNDQDVPLDSRLSLSLRSPATFPRDSVIELGSIDGGLQTKLSLRDGSLVLQDYRTVLAQLDLRKLFGGSAFGPFQLRIVTHDGVAGSWIPLSTIVRLPTLKEVRCSGSTAKECTLSGSDLYLLDGVAADPQFAAAVKVPDGFVGSTLAVPHPASDLLYLKLRDDPAAINSVSMPPTAP